MKKLMATLLLVGGTVLAAATFYDASLLTLALGLPIEGGEAVVALAAVALSTVLLLFGVLGLRKRLPDNIMRSAD